MFSFEAVDQIFILGATVIIILVLLFYRWSVATFEHFRTRNVQHSRPLPLVGNLGAMLAQRKTPLEVAVELYERFKHEPFYGVYRFRTPTLIITDPQLLRAILVKDFDHFTNHHDILLPAEQEPLLGNALLMLKDQKWRDMRSTMSSAFTGSKMRQMFELIQRTADGTVAALRRECDDAATTNADYVPELKDRFVRFMTDVIASTAFGVEINSLTEPENEFFTMGQRAIRFRLYDLIKVCVMSLLPRLTHWLGLQLFAPSVHSFFNRLVHDAIADRQKRGGIQRPDIIHLLMETRRGDVVVPDSSAPSAESDAFAVTAESTATELGANAQRIWSDAELTAQCFLFFVAGFETSSTVLSCVAHELALNDDIQQRLRTEIDAVRQSLAIYEHVGYDRLQRMPYMDAVVSEALRKWPPTATTDRVCVKPYELVTSDGQRRLRVNVGDVLMVPILGLQRDERYFPDAMRFDPERFESDRRPEIVPFTYLPFGGGPRSCIASRFALITIKAMLFELLSTFEVHTAANTQIPLRLLQRGFQTSAEHGFNLHLRPRKLNETLNNVDIKNDV